MRQFGCDMRIPYVLLVQEKTQAQVAKLATCISVKQATVVRASIIQEHDESRSTLLANR